MLLDLLILLGLAYLAGALSAIAVRWTVCIPDKEKE